MMPSLSFDLDRENSSLEVSLGALRINSRILRSMKVAFDEYGGGAVSVEAVWGKNM